MGNNSLGLQYGHLDLSGMQLGVDLRTGTTKTCVLKTLNRMVERC